MKLIEEAQLAEFNRFRVKLRTAHEGGESLLNDTAVLFGANRGNASSHNRTNLPIIVAGGRYRHGSHFVQNEKNNTPLSNMCVSLAHSFAYQYEQALPFSRFPKDSL